MFWWARLPSVPVYMHPISFLIAALLAGFSGYSYAALTSRDPKSTGEAVYLEMVNIALIIIHGRAQNAPESILEKGMKVKTWMPYSAAMMCVLFLGVQRYQLVSGATVAGLQS